MKKLVLVALCFLAVSSCKPDEEEEQQPAIEDCILASRIEYSNSTNATYQYIWEGEKILKIIKRNEQDIVLEEFDFQYIDNNLARINGTVTSVVLKYSNNRLSRMDYYQTSSNTFLYFDSLVYENDRLKAIAYYEENGGDFVSGGMQEFSWNNDQLTTYKLYEDPSFTGFPSLVYQLNFTAYDSKDNPYKELPLAWKAWRLVYNQPWVISKNNLSEGEEIDNGNSSTFSISNTYEKDIRLAEADDLSQSIVNTFIYDCN